ncbi:MAG: uracil-DNA glycosylase [Desulfobacteraceae bacterium]
MKENERVDCRKCRYYFVTWEPSQPHGCRAMGFKSLHFPSTVVRHNSGSRCRAFMPKSPKRSGRSSSG